MVLNRQNEHQTALVSLYNQTNLKINLSLKLKVKASIKEKQTYFG